MLAVLRTATRNGYQRAMALPKIAVVLFVVDGVLSYKCVYLSDVPQWHTLRTDYQNLLLVSFDCRCEMDD